MSESSKNCRRQHIILYHIRSLINQLLPVFSGLLEDEAEEAVGIKKLNRNAWNECDP